REDTGVMGRCWKMVWDSPTGSVTLCQLLPWSGIPHSVTSRTVNGQEVLDQDSRILCVFCLDVYASYFMGEITSLLYVPASPSIKK
ncbi:hypothetical protein H8957_016862, partial [Semnopithecus entellus]